MKKIKVETEKKIDMNFIKERQNEAFDKKTSKSRKAKDFYQNYYRVNKDKYEVRRMKKKSIEFIAGDDNLE